MSKRPTPDYAILHRVGRKTQVEIKLYAASNWAHKCFGNADGLYRVQVNGRWYGGEKYSFLSLHGAMALTEQLIAAELGHVCEQQPNMPRGTLVRVPVGLDACGRTRYEQARTWSDPEQLLDGRWSVLVRTFDGLERRPCSELLRKE